MNEAITAVASLLPAVPVLVVWLVGIGLALSRLKTHRRSSTLLAAGLFGLLAQRVLLTPVYPLLPLWLADRGFSTTAIGSIFAAISTIEALFGVIWYSLIIAAVVIREEDPR